MQIQETEERTRKLAERRNSKKEKKREILGTGRTPRRLSGKKGKRGSEVARVKLAKPGMIGVTKPRIPRCYMRATCYIHWNPVEH